MFITIILDEAFREAQYYGQSSALCDSDYTFLADYTSCTTCITVNIANSTDIQTYNFSGIATFVNYCLSNSSSDNLLLSA
jgi:hypothetical protein